MTALIGHRISGVKFLMDGEWREVILPPDCTGFDIHAGISEIATAVYRCHVNVVPRDAKGEKG